MMCWPVRRELWGSHLEAAERDYAEIARVIARYEPVTMIAPPLAAARASRQCGATVAIFELPIDDSWARDTGPLVVVDGRGHRRVIDYRFNGWGDKYRPYDDDDALASRLVTEWMGQRADWSYQRRAMVLEGGSIAVDGEGTLVTTQQCLLHPNRNPALARVQIEGALRDDLGASQVIWLPYGLADDQDTDGHVDNVAAFPRPGIVLLQGCHEQDESDHDRLAVNLRCVLGAPDARGRTLATVEMAVLPFAVVGARRVAVPYLNLFAGNGFVIVPVCGHPADDDMLDIVSACYPGRDVVPVPGATLAYGGGASSGSER